MTVYLASWASNPLCWEKLFHFFLFFYIFTVYKSAFCSLYSWLHIVGNMRSWILSIYSRKCLSYFFGCYFNYRNGLGNTQRPFFIQYSFQPNILLLLEDSVNPASQGFDATLSHIWTLAWDSFFQCWVHFNYRIYVGLEKCSLKSSEVSHANILWKDTMETKAYSLAQGFQKTTGVV
jgi:hypothetical protein